MKTNQKKVPLEYAVLSVHDLFLIMGQLLLHWPLLPTNRTTFNYKLFIYSWPPKSPDSCLCPSLPVGTVAATYSPPPTKNK